jgi:ABC-type Zn uptake system ZnuABC Zn-binding protein ZnuA
MSDTARVTIAVSQDNVDWIDANYNNRSAFIDELITDYRESAGQTENVVAQFRKRQIEAEIASLESQLESAIQQRQEIEAAVTTEEEHKQEVVEEAVEELGFDPSVGYDNAAAKNWAEKAGMDVEAFWAAYTEAYTDE